MEYPTCGHSIKGANIGEIEVAYSVKKIMRTQKAKLQKFYKFRDNKWVI